MNKPMTPPGMEHPKLLLDPYLAWAEKEGVPVTEDFGVDLLKCPTSHWPRSVSYTHLTLPTIYSV